MKKFLLSDFFFGILLTLFVAGSYIVGSAFLETFELKFYDLRSRFRQDQSQPNEVAIIAIDDDSLAQLGRWPWPRSRIAAMLDKLNSYGPKVIGLNILFSEPDRNPGISALDALSTQYKKFVSDGIVVEHDPQDLTKPLEPSATSPVLSQIEEAKKQLDEHAKLAAALQRKKVVLLMFFELSANLGGKPEPLPPKIARSAMTAMPSATGALNNVTSEKVSYPLMLFSGAAAGLGHVNVLTDPEGAE